MTENLIYNREKAWNEILEMARAQGIQSEESFRELVNEYFEKKVDLGELDEDQNIQELKLEVTGRWQQFKNEIGN